MLIVSPRPFVATNKTFTYISVGLKEKLHPGFEIGPSL